MAAAKKKTQRQHEQRKPGGIAKRKPRSGGRDTALAPHVGSLATTSVKSPFALMRRLADEMDRAFEEFRLGAPPVLPRLELPFGGREAPEAAWLPAVDVVERRGMLVVRADLPGLTKDDIHVEVREDALCISGERRYEHAETRKGLHHSERSYGSFYREIPLPEGSDPERAKASFRDGVLEVTLPAPSKTTKGRHVPIGE